MAVNVAPNADGDQTTAFSRADLGAGTRTVSTDGNGATGGFPHGLADVPDYAAIAYVYPSGGFGAAHEPGGWALSICDGTNIGFRIFRPDGTPYDGERVTVRWLAVIQ